MAFVQIQQILLFLIISSVRGELRFLALGDWGGMILYPYTTLYETAVSKSMGKIAEQLGTHFTIGLGKKPIYIGYIT